MKGIPGRGRNPSIITKTGAGRSTHKAECRRQSPGGLPRPRKEQVLTYGTLKEYRTVFKSLDDLQEKEKKRFTFSDFNQAFLTVRKIPFEQDQTVPKRKTSRKKVSFNDTIAKYCATLNFLQWCFENGYHQNPNAFKKIQNPN